MSPEILAVVVALAAQSVVLGYWGGNLSRLVKQHDREINGEPGGLRATRHEHANRLQEHEGRITELEEKESHHPERR